MQAPNAHDGDYEDYEVAGDIDNAGTNEDSILVDALAACCDDGFFANTLGGDGDDEGNGVENVDPETEPDGPPDGSPAATRRDKDALVEQEERDFGETHADSGNDLGVVEMLEQGVSRDFFLSISSRENWLFYQLE